MEEKKVKAALLNSHNNICADSQWLHLQNSFSSWDVEGLNVIIKERIVALHKSPKISDTVPFTLMVDHNERTARLK